MSDLIIENVPLTKEWLAGVVEKKLGVRPKIGTSSILDNSEMGYMSLIKKVALIFDDEQHDTHHDLPKHVVLKIVSGAKGADVITSAVGEELPDNSMAFENHMHDTECSYYNNFANAAEKPLRVPVIYAAENSKSENTKVPVIVMEMFEDCKVYDLCTGFNEKQLFKIVDEIVKLHVYSLTTEEWKLIVPDQSSLDVFANFSSMVKSIINNLSEQPGMGILKTFSKHTFDKDPNYLFTCGADYADGKRISVIAHGDLWAPQILWDKNDDVAGIIDWQITHRGSPLEDIHHVLSTCTSVENRRRLTQEIMDYYWDELQSGLKAKGAELPWTLEQFDEEFQHSMMQASALTIFANGFWSNSPVLQTDGKPDIARITESFSRCQAFVEDTCKVLNLE